MAKTITITIPPNTTVNLPSSETLQKMVSDSVTISVSNSTGQTIALEQSGSSSSLSVDTLPATISESDDIDLTVISAGSLAFDFGEDSETITVEIASAGSTGGLLLLGVG